MIHASETLKDISSKQQPMQFPYTETIEAALTRSYGSNSLAFFGLYPSNRHFLTSDGSGLVNYRLVKKVAVVLGDPICAPEALSKVVQSFLDFCAQHHWRVAFYQASSDHVPVYRALGLHTFKMGEEAVLRPQSFTLRGSALANVRTSSRRAEREGVSIQWYEGIPPMTAMDQLDEVSRTWLEHKAGSQAAETGFSTGRLDEVMEGATLAERIAYLPSSAMASSADMPRFVTAVATTKAGTACAFTTFTPLYASWSDGCNESDTHGWGWSLDLMRRMPDAPPGVMELILVRALERFRSCGAQNLSLGLVALADSSQEMTAVQRRLAGTVTESLHMLEGRQTLFNFKQKFHPTWQSRYLVTNSTLALPRIASAILQLRNYSGGGVARLLGSSEKQ